MKCKNLHDSATSRSLPLPRSRSDNASLFYIIDDVRVWRGKELHLGLVVVLVIGRLVRRREYCRLLFRPRGQLVGGPVVAEVLFGVAGDAVQGI